MTRQKIIDILLYTVTGFTIAHGLLVFLIIKSNKLYSQISLHYSDNLTWILIFFIIPLLTGLIFYYWLKNKQISKWIRILLGFILILQITFTSTASILNYNYWGYAFKRPTVFKEIYKADKIITCSRVLNTDSTGFIPLYTIIDTFKTLNELYGRRDIYYGKTDRLFMVFQDRVHINGYLNDYPEIYNSPNLKISKANLQIVANEIHSSNFIDKGEKGRITSGQLNGIITEFLTIDSTTYLFAGLDGGEVSNDHYPFYEFLFIKKDGYYKLIKKQRFYVDNAGIEGLEYANFAPIFSLLLSIIGLFTGFVIWIINRILRNRFTLKNNNAL